MPPTTTASPSIRNPTGATSGSPSADTVAMRARRWLCRYSSSGSEKIITRGQRRAGGPDSLRTTGSSPRRQQLEDLDRDGEDDGGIVLDSDLGQRLQPA